MAHIPADFLLDLHCRLYHLSYSVYRTAQLPLCTPFDRLSVKVPNQKLDQINGSGGYDLCDDALKCQVGVLPLQMASIIQHLDTLLVLRHPIEPHWKALL